jgi:hypothetical protein
MDEDDGVKEAVAKKNVKDEILKIERFAPRKSCLHDPQMREVDAYLLGDQVPVRYRVQLIAEILRRSEIVGI